MNVLLPIGLLMGLGLILVIFHLARQQTSWPVTLRAALKRNEFAVHYQPIVELSTQRQVGMEALLRWQRSDGIDARPDMFIRVAEDCGLIQRITAYVLDRIAVDSVALLARWPDCYISINLSAADLHSGSIVVALRRLLELPHIKPGNLVVEVTEHSLVEPEVARAVVRDIRALGIGVAIDDFGTGFSSLGYLANLRTDYLKIDRTFVKAAGTDSATSQVAVHIIQMAASLGLGVIAEGVETEAEATFLRRHGVEYAQGWLYSRALSPDQLLLTDHPSAARKPADAASEA